MSINLLLFKRNRKLEDDAIPTENLYPGKKIILETPILN